MKTTDGRSGLIPAEPFAEALRDNVELLADLLDAIRSECAQVDARAAELFFTGLATLIEAYLIIESPHHEPTVNLLIGRTTETTAISLVES